MTKEKIIDCGDSEIRVTGDLDKENETVYLIHATITQAEREAIEEQLPDKALKEHLFAVKDEVNEVLNDDSLTYPQFIAGIEKIFDGWTEPVEWQAIVERLLTHGDGIKVTGGIYSQASANTVALCDSILNQFDEGEEISVDNVFKASKAIAVLWKAYVK